MNELSENEDFDTTYKMVCCNEACQVYCRESCVKFMAEFLHCPYCGGRLMTETMAMSKLKKVIL